MEPCPCGLNQAYRQCCGKFIEGLATPTTPEELMRSRYTAYTQANIAYIEKTMRAPANNNFDPETAYDWAAHLTWLKLEVVHTSMDSAEKGFVEFCAHFADEKKRYVMHEISEFHLIDGKWFYIDGRRASRKTSQQPAAPGRNDACPCGSQKKYKKCCGKAG